MVHLFRFEKMWPWEEAAPSAAAAVPTGGGLLDGLWHRLTGSSDDGDENACSSGDTKEGKQPLPAPLQKTQHQQHASDRRSPPTAAPPLRVARKPIRKDSGSGGQPTATSSSSMTRTQFAQAVHFSANHEQAASLRSEKEQRKLFMLEQKEKMRQRGMQNKQQRYYQGLEAVARKAASAKKEAPHVVDLGSLKSEDRAEIRRMLTSDTMRDAW